MPKFVKKPVVIDAIQFKSSLFPTTLVFETPTEHKTFAVEVDPSGERTIPITTLEGTMRASEGDYIIRGIKGEYYPCKPDIFEASYQSF